MALATVDGDGMPDVRMVLLKGLDANGFVFFTNLESAKGRELAANPKAALCFHWKSLGRQVRVRGPVARVTAAEADAYFAAAARGSRIGAWASQQSRPLTSRVGAGEGGRGARRRSIAIGDIPRPRALVGLPPRPGRDRVLAGGRLPPPRPRPLHAGGRRLGEGAALSVGRCVRRLKIGTATTAEPSCATALTSSDPCASTAIQRSQIRWERQR